MSESKHTPAPGVVMPRPALSHDDHGWRNAIHGDCGVYVASDRMHERKTDGTPMREQQEANADIIAAAPEMLALLEEVAGAKHYDSGTQLSDDFFVRLDAVIKKAIGGKP